MVRIVDLASGGDPGAHPRPSGLARAEPPAAEEPPHQWRRAATPMESPLGGRAATPLEPRLGGRAATPMDSPLGEMPYSGSARGNVGGGISAKPPAGGYAGGW